MIIIASYSNVSVTYTADGTQTVFSFPFDYLRKAFVYVEVNEETTLTQGTDYSVSEKTVVFATAPASGTVLRIYRSTDTTPLVSWADASVLRAKDMTLQQIQDLHILEEQDYWTRYNAMLRDGNTWDARGFQIKDVADPTDPTDAVNKEYLEAEAIVKNSDDTYWVGQGLPIKNIGEPTDNSDVATKQYADNNFMRLDDDGTTWVGRGLPVRNIATPGQTKDATTKEYVDNLIDSLSVAADRYVVFNTVAAMVAADLPAGYNTKTLGYYDINDGGAGVYSIRGKVAGETEDGGYVIFLINGNVAELVTDDTIFVEQWGAIGEYTINGLQRINNYIINNAGIEDNPKHYKIIGGNVVINESWEFTMPNQWTTYDLSFISLEGDFNDYLLKIKGITQCSSITIGSMFNPSGHGIRIAPANNTEWMQYIKIKSDIISVNRTQGYYGICVDGTGNFANEIDITVTRFGSAWHGIHLVKTNGCILNHCGFEYGSLYIENSNYTTILGCRNIETTTSGKNIETVGACNQLVIIGGCWLTIGSSAGGFQFSDQTFGKVITASNDSSFFGMWRNGIEYIIWMGRIYNEHSGKYVNTGSNTTYTTEDKKWLVPGTIFNVYNCSTLILDGKVYGHINGVNTITLLSCRASVGTEVKIKIDNTTYTICKLDSNKITGTENVQLRWEYNESDHFSTSHWTLSKPLEYLNSTLDS